MSRSMWAGRDTMVLAITKETAVAVTFRGTNDIKIESIIWVVVGRESMGRVFICIISLAVLRGVEFLDAKTTRMTLDSG
jgi:hypothetical protein